MSLGKYVSACRDQLTELKDSLSVEDLPALATDYGIMIRDGWVEWLIYLPL